METLLFRWSTYFNFYWPHLEILHNPRSKVHWIKALRALQASKLDNAGYPIQPCLIVAAARYGLARLKNCPALGEIVLNTLLDPMSQQNWSELCEKDNIYLEECLKDQIKNCNGTGYQVWRPPGYEAPTATEKYHPGLEASILVAASLELAQHLISAMDYLEHLREEHCRIYKLHCQRTRENLGIGLKVIPLHTIDETDRNCYICYERYLDPLKMLAPLRESSSHQQELAKIGYAFMECPKYVDEWTQRLKDNYLGTEHAPDRWDMMIMRELKHFTYGLTCARYRFICLMQDRASDGCSTPVKLSCGHIFGFQCIETWLGDHWTCPTCRADLRTKGTGILVSRQDMDPQLRQLGEQLLRQLNTREGIQDARSVAVGAMVMEGHPARSMREMIEIIAHEAASHHPRLVVALQDMVHHVIDAEQNLTTVMEGNNQQSPPQERPPQPTSD